MALKVYRTPIGFHDAYVAASSQKAALAAWGADNDLFARGVAEMVTDPTLTADALARPGEVVRRLRASAREQLAAAIPHNRAPRKPAAISTPRSKLKPKPAPEPSLPRPDRRAVEAAAQALADAETAYRAREAALAAEEHALAERRQAARTSAVAERDRLEAEAAVAQQAYAADLKAWQRQQDRGADDQ